MNGGNSSGLFSHFASAVSELSGRPVTFALAVGLVLVWAISGPVFGFSETWQLIINTATTIVTFLMVFVLQNSQNRDGHALQAKLDEEALQEVCEAHAEGVDSVEEILAEEILSEENAGPTAPR